MGLSVTPLRGHNVWKQEINVQEPQQRFKANARVRLREGVDPGFYNGFSRVGNEGWVRKRKLDKYGYPQVLVEWDKDHWAYNGQPDGWTWEGHFEIAEDANMSETPDKNQRDEALQTLAETFVKGVVSIIDGGEGPAKSEPVVAEGAVEEHWTEAAVSYTHLDSHAASTAWIGSRSGHSASRGRTTRS